MEEETGSTCPPRSYACMFCKKGFTSAQALGGHMNVHRRDRALLRQCRSPNNANSQHNVPPGEQVMTGHRPGSAEDQMASVYKVPISGDLQSNLAPFSRPCSSSWPSVVIRGTLTTRFSVSNDDHGACAARDLENEVTLEGTEDGLDLELRLGEKP